VETKIKVMEHIKTEGDIHTYEITTKELQTIMRNIKKPRFTAEEKSTIIMLCNGFMQDHPYDSSVKDVQKLLKKF
jgi:hypothetical protein